MPRRVGSSVARFLLLLAAIGAALVAPRAADAAPSISLIPVSTGVSFAVYRPPTGQWFIRHSSDGQLSVVSWGSAPLGDVPLPRPAALR